MIELYPKKENAGNCAGQAFARHNMQEQLEGLVGLAKPEARRKFSSLSIPFAHGLYDDSSRSWSGQDDVAVFLSIQVRLFDIDHCYHFSFNHSSGSLPFLFASCLASTPSVKPCLQQLRTSQSAMVMPVYPISRVQFPTLSVRSQARLSEVRVQHIKVTVHPSPDLLEMLLEATPRSN